MISTTIANYPKETLLDLRVRAREQVQKLAESAGREVADVSAKVAYEVRRRPLLASIAALGFGSLGYLISQTTFKEGELLGEEDIAF